MGARVRYDGRAKPVQGHWLARWSAEGRVVTLCPELAGGFPVPRRPAEIEPGAAGADVLAGRARIFEDTGTEVTAGFRRGAREAVRLAKATGCRYALLTDGSPSCGSTRIHGGRFDGITRTGEGVVAAALRAAGVAVYADHEVAALAKALGAPENAG